MFKVIEERSIKVFLKTQMELLGRKIIVSEMKTILHEFNSRLDNVKENINKLEDIAIGTIQKGAQNSMKVLLPFGN